MVTNTRWSSQALPVDYPCCYNVGGIYLEAVNIPQSILYMGIDHQLCQPENLPTQMKCIPKPRFLSLLGCQGLDRFQVEVVVQMEVVQVLSVNQ